MAVWMIFNCLTSAIISKRTKHKWAQILYSPVEEIVQIVSMERESDEKLKSTSVLHKLRCFLNDRFYMIFGETSRIQGLNLVLMRSFFLRRNRLP